MIRILAILKSNGVEGVIIAGHAPQMACAAPWHAGKAHTWGFVLAAMAMLDKPPSAFCGIQTQQPEKGDN